MIKKLSLIFLAGIFLPAYLFATPPCIPGFTTGLEANGDTVCVGIPVSFTNTSDLGGELLTFKQWDFGDGSNPINIENPTHIYTQAGTWTVSFSLASASCTGMSPVLRTITVIDPPMGMAFSTQDASCFGFCDGEAQLDIQIAPHGNYAILWDDDDAQTTATATNLCAGIYSVNASDIYGCSADFTQVVINDPDEIIVNAGSDIFICEGSQWPLSEATVVSGGIGSFDYQWEPGLSLNDPTLLNPILDVDDPGDFGVYTLTAIDDNGCTGSGQLQVTQSPGAIHGTIIEPGTGSAMSGILVSLIKRGNDDTQWETYDTYTTLGDGMFHFINLPLVDYIVKAEQVQVPAAYMPIYYHPSSDSIFDWEEAHITSVDCGEMISNTDIEMVLKPEAMNGDCDFEGMVYLVTIGKTQTEDPIPLIDVIVKKTPPGNAIAWTQTGDDTVWPKGYYRFDSVAVSADTISFVVNIPGLGMQGNYEIIVAIGDSLYQNLNFYVDTTANTGGIFTYNPLGVEALKYKPHEMMAFPNPFADNCELRFTNIENTGFTFTLFDVTGKQIIRDEKEQGNTYTINTQTLDQGIYIAEVKTGDEVFRTRVMKK